LRSATDFGDLPQIDRQVTRRMSQHIQKNILNGLSLLSIIC